MSLVVVVVLWVRVRYVGSGLRSVAHHAGKISNDFWLLNSFRSHSGCRPNICRFSVHFFKFPLSFITHFYFSHENYVFFRWVYFSLESFKQISREIFVSASLFPYKFIVYFSLYIILFVFLYFLLYFCFLFLHSDLFSDFFQLISQVLQSFFFLTKCSLLFYDCFGCFCHLF